MPTRPLFFSRHWLHLAYITASDSGCHCWLQFLSGSTDAHRSIWLSFRSSPLLISPAVLPVIDGKPRSTDSVHGSHCASSCLVLALLMTLSAEINQCLLAASFGIPSCARTPFYFGRYALLPVPAVVTQLVTIWHFCLAFTSCVTIDRGFNCITFHLTIQCFFAGTIQLVRQCSLPANAFGYSFGHNADRLLFGFWMPHQVPVSCFGHLNQWACSSISRHWTFLAVFGTLCNHAGRLLLPYIFSSTGCVSYYLTFISHWSCKQTIDAFSSFCSWFACLNGCFQFSPVIHLPHLAFGNLSDASSSRFCLRWHSNLFMN